jgi:hypothetical protein
MLFHNGKIKKDTRKMLTGRVGCGVGRSVGYLLIENIGLRFIRREET